MCMRAVTAVTADTVKVEVEVEVTAEAVMQQEYLTHIANLLKYIRATNELPTKTNLAHTTNVPNK